MDPNDTELNITQIVLPIGFSNSVALEAQSIHLQVFPKLNYVPNILQYISFSNNKIESFGIEDLYYMEKLLLLDLSENNIFILSRFHIVDRSCWKPLQRI